MQKGLVHIYYGDGKGKTTSGMGLCVRAAGAGMKVLIFQYLKKGDSSELNVLKKLPNVTIIPSTKNAKFLFAMTEEEKKAEKEFYQKMFAEISAMVAEKEIDVLFMDEAIHAVNAGLLPEAELLAFLKSRPEKLEVILNGYNPSPKLIEAADYVSHIQKIKHPFDAGIPDRIGIEK